MKVFFKSEQRKFEISKAVENLIEKVVEETLKHEKIYNENIEVSVLFTNNRNIRKLNLKYRNIDKPTDVLSFPIYEEQELEDVLENYEKNDGPLMLGDIIISMEKVDEQSKEYGHSFERELGYMTCHSLLHLIGYDHMTDEEKQVMREKEEKILEGIKLTRNK